MNDATRRIAEQMIVRRTATSMAAAIVANRQPPQIVNEITVPPTPPAQVIIDPRAIMECGAVIAQRVTEQAAASVMDKVAEDISRSVASMEATAKQVGDAVSAALAREQPAPQITVNVPEPSVVVSAPMVEVTNVVETPNVTVNVPPPKKVTKKAVRDEAGRWIVTEE